MLKVMRDLAAEGRTMLIVTHEMAFARDVSSRILFLDQGRINAEGAPGALFGGGLDAQSKTPNDTVAGRFAAFL